MDTLPSAAARQQHTTGDHRLNRPIEIRSSNDCVTFPTLLSRCLRPTRELRGASPGTLCRAWDPLYRILP